MPILGAVLFTIRLEGWLQLISALWYDFPYYSHTTPIRIPKGMGIVWEAYHKGVWLLEAPGITIELRCADRNLWG